jgi:hypothetical protein
VSNTQGMNVQILSGSSVKTLGAGSVADDEVLVSGDSEGFISCFPYRIAANSGLQLLAESCS